MYLQRKNILGKLNNCKEAKYLYSKTIRTEEDTNRCKHSNIPRLEELTATMTIPGSTDVVMLTSLGPAGRRTDVREWVRQLFCLWSEALHSSPCQRQGCGTGLPSGLSKGTEGVGDQASLEQQTVASHFPLQGGVWRLPPCEGLGAGHPAALPACLWEWGLPGSALGTPGLALGA